MVSCGAGCEKLGEEAACERLVRLQYLHDERGIEAAVPAGYIPEWQDARSIHSARFGPQRRHEQLPAVGFLVRLPELNIFPRVDRGAVIGWIALSVFGLAGRAAC